MKQSRLLWFLPLIVLLFISSQSISIAQSYAVETQIDGDFDGWEGETVVKLVNGEVWQQTDYHYEYLYAFMPNVVIYRTRGGFKMHVEGSDKAVGVERLK